MRGNGKDKHTEEHARLRLIEMPRIESEGEQTAHDRDDDAKPKRCIPGRKFIQASCDETQSQPKTEDDHPRSLAATASRHTKPG